ncbi:MAG: hypothetical protein K9K32_03380 [Halanaerobiales bacterium]|nr:hypothetical protein [Halanaerobiales bacterium]
MKFLIWTGALLLVILVFIFLLSQISYNNFQKTAEKTAEEIINKGNQKDINPVIKKNIDTLPAPVQRWMRYSQVLDTEKIVNVRLKQKGIMKTKPDQKGIKTDAVQYFNLEQPSFIWIAKVKIIPFLYFAGRDTYLDGKGEMLIKVLSLFPVVNETGSEINQGTLTRYLGEIVWFPHAALSQYIKWEEIDSNSAKATMSYKGTKASAVFNFDDQGRVTEYNCDRYYSGDQGYSLEKYHVPVWDYKEFSGIKVPTKGKAIWKLDTGDFEYYTLKIIDIDYNIDSLY